MGIRKLLISGFIQATGKYPEHTALKVDGADYSYGALARLAAEISASIKAGESQGYPLVALLAYRSISAYAGALGILMAGKGYVPLNPNFPAERNFNMLSLSGCRIMVVGRECLGMLKSLLPKLGVRFAFIFPDTRELDELRNQYPNHLFIGADDVAAIEGRVSMPDNGQESIAYLLFTSGSTGVPKGVCVSNQNARAYVDYTCARYGCDHRDRFSQAFDMTFDLSVHDLFVCWEHGGCLCVIPESTTMAPAKFIKDNKLTMWFSVPSVAMFMSRMRMLKAGSFPSLRFSLFCGEPLPATLAQQWQDAAPNSVVENLYGPTEATIAITNYRWNNSESPAVCRNGIVPIGRAFEGQRTCVVDQALRVLPAGQTGELCLGGSQVTGGYLNDPEKTTQAFVRIPQMGDGIWYLTGDLALEDENGYLHYLGRIDNQVKIRGYRVELQEIDAALRKASGSEMAVCVAWPLAGGSAEGVVAFICGANVKNERPIIDYCKGLLPPYMIPTRVEFINDMPLNVNGKIDRLALLNMLKKENG